MAALSSQGHFEEEGASHGVFVKNDEFALFKGCEEVKAPNCVHVDALIIHIFVEVNDVGGGLLTALEH
ncbi:hypothetical protein SDC9_76724 [bioreactor metagenome]|uniref:Uncharacterized protein n=1 Tax=bioreactor metagenome TaxID=1076179 RepID=A0A644YPD9_9ZZZZ